MSKINFAMFMAGMTVGAAGAWFYCKRYYEQIAQEEIDSVKAAFIERKPNMPQNTMSDKTSTDDNKHKADMAKLKPDLVNYAAKLQEEGYTNYSAHSEKITNVKKEDEPVIDKPYVISPEDNGESTYTQINLTYYADGILADDEDEILDDIENTVGLDFATHFGEYEEDTVFIRNDRLRCEYEIQRDNRTYEEVSGIDPNNTEG